MGFISDKDIEERVSSPQNLINRLSIHEISKQGKKEGDVNTPPEIQKVIAQLANDKVEKAGELAKAFNVSDALVSNLKAGEIVHGQKSPALQEVIGKIKSRRGDAESLAITNLMASLEPLKDLIPQIKSAKKLTSVAKDMAIIANHMADKSDAQNTGANVHLHLYGPKQKSVNDYEIIDV